MSKNGGQDTLEFQAEYSDSVTHSGCKQDNDPATTEGVFSIISTSSRLPAGEHSILALTVFRFNKLQDWPLRPILWVQAWKEPDEGGSGPSASEEFSLPLGFDYGDGGKAA